MTRVLPALAGEIDKFDQSPITIHSFIDANDNRRQNRIIKYGWIQIVTVLDTGQSGMITNILYEK